MKDYSKYSYEKLGQEEDKFKGEYDKLSDECAKKGDSWETFQEKSHDIKEALYFISKYKRLKQSPIVEYGKEWKGDTFTLEEFAKQCREGLFIDSDGVGFYATSDARSNVEIYPSDIMEDLYRKDFTHIIWFNK